MMQPQRNSGSIDVPVAAVRADPPATAQGVVRKPGRAAGLAGQEQTSMGHLEVKPRAAQVVQTGADRLGVGRSVESCRAAVTTVVVVRNDESIAGRPRG